MNNVMIWGVSGGLGMALAECFRGMGDEVIGVSRNATNLARLSELKIEAIDCDATNETQVSNCLDSVSAKTLVISTMGSFNDHTPVDYIGHRNLINALEANQIKRFLMVTSIGCGDTWKYLSEKSKKGFGAAVREKSLAESWLKSSTLDYTILRPGGLFDGEATNNGQLFQNQETHGLIRRYDVALLVKQLLMDDSSIHATYECIDPSLNY
ncbi:MAG: NAD(P)H-binding protein [Pseudomonadota bacterium]